MASALCDFLQIRWKDRRGIRFAWATIDAALLTLILIARESLQPTRLLIYPLMLVASGFWSRVSLVWYVTGLALLSYVLVQAKFRIPSDPADWHQHLSS